jgi:hypothetical protein
MNLRYNTFLLLLAGSSIIRAGGDQQHEQLSLETANERTRCMVRHLSRSPVFNTNYISAPSITRNGVETILGFEGEAESFYKSAFPNFEHHNDPAATTFVKHKIAENYWNLRMDAARISREHVNAHVRFFNDPIRVANQITDEILPILFRHYFTHIENNQKNGYFDMIHVGNKSFGQTIKDSRADRFANEINHTAHRIIQQNIYGNRSSSAYQAALNLGNNNNKASNIAAVEIKNDIQKSTSGVSGKENPIAFNNLNTANSILLRLRSSGKTALLSILKYFKR